MLELEFMQFVSESSNFDIRIILETGTAFSGTGKKKSVLGEKHLPRCIANRWKLTNL